MFVFKISQQEYPNYMIQIISPHLLEYSLAIYYLF